MDNDSLWNTFSTTGKVEDYLNYVKAKDADVNKGEQPNDFGQNQGTYSAGNKTQ